MSCMKKYHPSRSTPLTMSQTEAYLVVRAVALSAFEGRRSLIWRRTIRQFMHVGLSLRTGRFQESGQQRWHHYSHAQELCCVHGGIVESRCWVRVYFLKCDLAEAHLFHRELGQLMFDNGNGQSGSYLC